MNYKLTEDYLYIQHNANKVEGIPLKTLSNEELGAIIKTLVVNGEWSKEIKVRLEENKYVYKKL